MNHVTTQSWSRWIEPGTPGNRLLPPHWPGRAFLWSNPGLREDPKGLFGRGFRKNGDVHGGQSISRERVNSISSIFIMDVD